MGASGSSMMRAKLWVFAGGSPQESFGETSGPSQVNFFGIDSPAEKAGLEICNAIAPPFACEKSFPGDNMEMHSKKPVRTANFPRTAASSFYSHSSRSAAAQKFRAPGLLPLPRSPDLFPSLVRRFY